jgi:hypothetical protein
MAEFLRRGVLWGWRRRRARGPVVPDGVDPDDLAVPGQLHGPVDGLAGPAAAGLVVRADETDHAGAVGQPDHGQPGGGIAGPPGHPGPRRPVGLIGAEPLRVGGDHHPRVHDVHQTPGHYDLDRLTRVGRADRVGEPARDIVPRAFTHRDTPDGRSAVGRETAARAA